MVELVADEEPLIDKKGKSCSIFLNQQSVFILAGQSAAQIGPSVLDSGDTEEMDVQPVKGKSFISVDLLGQVD